MIFYERTLILCVFFNMRMAIESCNQMWWSAKAGDVGIPTCLFLDLVYACSWQSHSPKLFFFSIYSLYEWCVVSYLCNKTTQLWFEFPFMTQSSNQFLVCYAISINMYACLIMGLNAKFYTSKYKFQLRLILIEILRSM